MKKISIIIALITCILVPAQVEAKYKLDITQKPIVEQLNIGRNGKKWLKVTVYDKNVNKAIERAQMDAIAACLFYGVEENRPMGCAEILPICNDEARAFSKHKKFFENFFKVDKKGEQVCYMSFVERVHDGYPTGEDNIAIEGGKRKVRIEVLVDYNKLLKHINESNIAINLSIND